jgi:hypothetical protein
MIQKYSSELDISKDVELCTGDEKAIIAYLRKMGYENPRLIFICAEMAHFVHGPIQLEPCDIPEIIF